jgi:M6 family metalloprotease-like protein
MKIKICAPRIFGRSISGRAICIGLLLVGSTSVLAHNAGNTDNSDAQAAAAQLQRDPGQHVQLEGQLEIIHQDFNDGHGRFVYTLKQADGTRVPVHFLKGAPTQLLTGDHVRADGQLSGGSLVLYSGSTSLTKTTTSNGKTTPAPTAPSIPVPNTFGAQSVLVILVNFQDDVVEPYTVADAQNAFFVSANNFIQENSYGQTSLTGAVVGWYTIPDSVTTCNTSQIATDAQSAAAAAGVNLANYTRFAYMFPQDNACGFAGASNVGGNPSQSWINGTTGPGGTTLDTHVIDHELGHAFGLWHSHLYDCGTIATICSSPSIDEYGDILDTMGAPQPRSPHYNAFQKERLGWLNYGVSPSIQTVTNSGTYTINPYELGAAGPNALKILKSTDPTTGAKTWYYVESRQALGFDSFLTSSNTGCSSCYTQNETTGVLFHLGTDGDGNTGDLLDMTPATLTYHWWFDPSLVMGQSFSDPNAGVTFTPTAVDSTGATVQITLNGSSCTRANPTVSVSPPQGQNVTSGTAVNFAVTVTDNDSSTCAPATFNLANGLPSGWTGVWNATALSLSPGKNGSATLTVTSPAGAADGSYGVSVGAANAAVSSYAGSAMATYVISTPGALSVSMWTDQSSYLPGQTVAIRVSVLSGTSPDAGASVSVVVTSPGGRATTLSGTTGSNGLISLNYKLSRRAVAGTYQVQLGATATGAASIAGASTSFTVQ